TDIDGDSLTVTAVTQGAHGTVGINADGTLTYTPAADYFGGDSFSYTAGDGHGGTAVGLVGATVNSATDAPSFTPGADGVVDESNPAPGGHALAGWATGISAGPANESGQMVSFVVTGNTNPGLFSFAPAISPDGTLSFTTAD